MDQYSGFEHEVVGFEGKLVWDCSKPDGMPRKLMDSSKLDSLGWTPKLNEDFQRNKPFSLDYPAHTQTLQRTKLSKMVCAKRKREETISVQVKRSNARDGGVFVCGSLWNLNRWINKRAWLQ
ncbi:Uncharacterized protein Rs2_50401 [Raphanus sativus]|nr:Uncharacterized protein Rs2_50401 [Raphanus sativus]